MEWLVCAGRRALSESARDTIRTHNKCGITCIIYTHTSTLACITARRTKAYKYFIKRPYNFVFQGVFSLKMLGAAEIENSVTALQVKSISSEMMAEFTRPHTATPPSHPSATSILHSATVTVHCSFATHTHTHMLSSALVPHVPYHVYIISFIVQLRHSSNASYLVHSGRIQDEGLPPRRPSPSRHPLRPPATQRQHHCRNRQGAGSTGGHNGTYVIVTVHTRARTCIIFKRWCSRSCVRVRKTDSPLIPDRCYFGFVGDFC